ncbi:MAG: bifunctional nuclease family protein [Chloroflexota bacterium]|nr:bifunctional nuclease family protein [Chloroflexota bacterium]MDP9473438.1 bifunctional nuclease family protein [Chloroflexota bacterium]
MEAGTQLVTMRIADVWSSPNEAGEPCQYAMVLEEVDGPRSLLIGVEPLTAVEMALYLVRVQPPRPLTYALIADLLGTGGGELRGVRFEQLVDDILLAIAVVEGAKGIRNVYARPADALALALVAGSPIEVDPAVLADSSSHSHLSPRHRSGGKFAEGAANIAMFVMAEWPTRYSTP